MGRHPERSRSSGGVRDLGRIDTAARAAEVIWSGADKSIIEPIMPKVTSNGRVTIPIKVRSAIGLRPGDRVEFVERENGQLDVVAARRSVRDLKGMFKGRRSKPVSIRQMNTAIAERASRSR